jgi:hypothetical protein
VRTGFDPLSVAIGAVAFPAVLLAWQWTMKSAKAAPRTTATTDQDDIRVWQGVYRGHRLTEGPCEVGLTTHPRASV